MKKVLAIAVGLVVHLALFGGLDHLGNIIGVPGMIYFDEPKIYVATYGEEEVSGEPTPYGLGIYVISILLAARAGMAVFSRSWKGGISQEGETLFLAWFIGSMIFGAFGAILYRAFRDTTGTIPHILYRLFEIASAIGIYWSMKRWYSSRMMRLNNRRYRK